MRHTNVRSIGHKVVFWLRTWVTITMALVVTGCAVSQPAAPISNTPSATSAISTPTDQVNIPSFTQTPVSLSITDTLTPGLTTTPSPSPVPSQTPTLKPIAEKDSIAFAQNKNLGRGINIGNALEAPKEGDWGVTLQPNLFQLIKDAGFNSVRLPIRWSGHTSLQAPFTIEPAFLTRVDWAVQQCLDRGLSIILDMHAYDEAMNDPEGQKAKFISIWQQLALHYKGYPNSVYFELLNEPTGTLAVMSLNQFYNEAIQMIRKSNPKRTIILGPGGYYSIEWLDYLNLPDDDRNIIVSVHYYLPFHFTHQGADWVVGSDAWLGTRWEGNQAEKDAIAMDFAGVVKWAETYNRPIFLGEFGAYSMGQMEDRARWTSEVVKQADARGWSWAYWEFCSGFGIYNLSTQTWNEALVKALIP